MRAALPTAWALAAACSLDAGRESSTTAARELRACADPNNLPFSNDRGEGFENRLAELVAGEMRARLRYTCYARPNPPACIIEPLAAGEIDVAVAWDLLAGYFAPRQPVTLEIAPVSPRIDLPFLPFVLDIAVGVARRDTALQEELEHILAARDTEAQAILDEFGVPRLASGRRAAGRQPPVRPIVRTRDSTIPREGKPE